MFTKLNSRSGGGSRVRRGLAAAATAALVVSPLAAIAPASANLDGTGLVISEVYGGGGNGGATFTHDFIELYNPTAAPIVVDGWSVQYRSATGTTAALTNLTGSVPAGEHYLVQEASTAAVGAPLPTPDASGSIAMSGSNGVVLLVSNQTPFTTVGNLAGVTAGGLVDMVGFGTTPTSFETANTGVALTATTAATRNPTGGDNDDNAADFSELTPDPQNSVVENGPVVETVADKSFSVDEAIADFTLTATGGVAPYTWSATGLPAGLSLDPATGVVSGTPTAVGVSAVTATVTDADDATGQDTFNITVNPAAGEVIPISGIQGTGATSPFAGTTLTTEGVVTALYPAGGFNGFFVQTEGTGSGADATPGASDGLFVFGGAVDESTLAIGDFLEVTGQVTEFFGSTQITPAAAGDVVTQNGEAHTDPVARAAALPGTDCVVGACPAAGALAADREAHEGELYAPTGPFTVTNSFSLTNGGNGFMEIGLSADTKPLMAPTEVADFQTGNIADLTAFNAAHGIVLDDGSSFNYTAGDNGATPRQSGIAMPWITPTHSVRVGADATFTGPVVLDFRNNAWKLQPTSQVTGIGANVATFEQTRAANTTPTDVGGDLVLGTFNVLNYFNTTGQAWVGAGNTCTFFNDRELNPITNNSCSNNGPRGAARAADLTRQQAKIVTAINTMNADVVSLEEIENSVALGEADRDDALSTLVAALNVAAGTTRWAFAPSPAPADLPPTAEQDVIRTAFIYNPATVALVGASDVLADAPAFANAREPLAQAFKKVGNPDSSAFGVIVNHFKSKSASGASGDNLDTGQGGYNGDRTRQAAALVAFADEFKAARSITKVFLTGDFNSYTNEDPVQALEAAGYTQVESDTEGEESYSFSGLSGSLDHVFANEAAFPAVTGADIWDINASEPLAYQYSRFNYNVTDFFDSTHPFNSSDHNPEVVGIDTSLAPTEIQILGINDFHGRILNEDGTNGTSNGPVAGAAILSGAVKQLRTANPNTVFAAAGDLIGASTFESFIQKDKPTIDALNEAGLEVSAVGNHELDAGYDDLVNRVMAPYDATTNPLGGAEWQYIAANLRKQSDDSHAVPDSWIKDFGDVEVGFVGAVTEDLPSLVSPDGIADIEVTDIVTEVNESADALEADGADVIVLLIHEGAATTALASATDPNSAFGQVVNGVDTNIDAIVSGHTHLAYNHAVPVPAWVTEGRPVTTRPVVSAGQYGTFLNQLNLTVDTASGDVLALTQNVLNLKAQTTPFAANYPVDPAVTPIVNDAIAQSNVLGAVELGKIAAPFNRAKLSNGTTENRGGESTLGNLVAEVQRWATESPEAGAAQIAFMNPGGLRADMVGNAGGFPATLTYKQAAVVQPFANTLVNMQLTGAQIKTALEQQWQRDGAGNIPTRPFLRLGTSEGFNYTYDPSRPEGDRVIGMWLNGAAIGATTSYSVTVNSFLGSGGDNFRVFAQGTQKRDTGKIDLQGMVDYMAEFANAAQGDAPLAPNYTQHSVGVDFPAGAPASYEQGDLVTFNVSSLAFSTAADVKDTQVDVRYGNVLLGSIPVDNTIGTAVFDEYGTATVTVTVPNGAPDGTTVLEVTGNNTGTTIDVPILVSDDREASTITVPDVSVEYGQAGALSISVSPEATGTVEIFEGTTSLGTAVLDDSEATFALAAESLAVGVHTLRVAYPGDENLNASSTMVDVTVTKATSSVAATVAPAELKANVDTGTISVTVTGKTPTGLVGAIVNGQVIGGAELVNGAATITIGPFATTGTKAIEVRYYGDDRNRASSANVSVNVIANPVPEKETPVVTATVNPATLKVKKGTTTVAVTVTRPGGTPTGNVLAMVDNKVVGAGDLVAGKVNIVIGPFDTVGAKAITLKYTGDDNTKAGNGSASVTVQKATPKLTVKAPKKLKTGEVLELSVVANAEGFTVTGQVTAKVKGTSKTKTLMGGEVEFRLGQFNKAGTYEVVVSYLGSDLAETVTQTIEVKVKKDKHKKH